MDQLIALVSYFVLVCVSAERFTDILKRSFLEKLNATGVVYQSVSAVFGAFVGYLVPPEHLPVTLNPFLGALLIGLCVSGGSSFWNTILTTLTEFSKSLKEVKAPTSSK